MARGHLHSPVCCASNKSYKTYSSIVVRWSCVIWGRRSSVRRSPSTSTSTIGIGRGPVSATVSVHLVVCPRTCCPSEQTWQVGLLYWARLLIAKRFSQVQISDQIKITREESKEQREAKKQKTTKEQSGQEIHLKIVEILCYQSTLFYVTNIGLQSTDIVLSYIRTFTVMLLFPKNCRATANSFWPSSLWLKSKIGAGRKMLN